MIMLCPTSSLNKRCWVLSSLIPQTNLSLNISFNDSPYSQYSVNLLNSATSIETLSFAFLTRDWIWNVRLSYLGVDFDDATLTASVHQKVFYQDSTELSILWITYMSLFRINLAILLSSGIHPKFYLLQKTILTVQYMCSSRLHSC